MWKFHRSMTRPFFAKDKIVHFDTFAMHADEAISKIRERGGKPIDFQVRERVMLPFVDYPSST